MPSGYTKGGVDLDTLFEPIGASTKGADVGYKSGGVDISNRYYNLAGGGSKIADVGIKKGGVDISNNFAGAGTVSYYTFGEWGSAGGAPTVQLPDGNVITLDYFKNALIDNITNPANYFIAHTDVISVVAHDTETLGFADFKVTEIWSARVVLDAKLFKNENQPYGYSNNYARHYTVYGLVAQDGFMDVLFDEEHHVYNRYAVAPYTKFQEGRGDAGYSSNAYFPQNKLERQRFNVSTIKRRRNMTDWVGQNLYSQAPQTTIPEFWTTQGNWLNQIHSFAQTHSHTPALKIGADYANGNYGMLTGGVPPQLTAWGINLQYLGTYIELDGWNVDGIQTGRTFAEIEAEVTGSLPNVQRPFMFNWEVGMGDTRFNKGMVFELWGGKNFNTIEAGDTHLLYCAMASNGKCRGALNFRNTGYEGGVLNGHALNKSYVIPSDFDSAYDPANVTGAVFANWCLTKHPEVSLPSV